MRDPTPADAVFKVSMDENPWVLKAKIIDNAFPAIDTKRGISPSEDLRADIDLNRRFTSSKWSNWCCTGRVPNPFFREITEYKLKMNLLNPYVQHEFEAKKEMMERAMVRERALWALKQQRKNMVVLLYKMESFTEAAQTLKEAGERPTKKELV